MSKVIVDVVSAEKSLFSGEAEFVVAPAKMGEVGIYPNHAPMITTLKPGSVRIKLSGKAEEELIYVSGGILEVQPGSVTVLSDTAVRGQDLDEAKANQAKKAAEDTLNKQKGDIDYAKAQAELAEAAAMIQAIQRLRKKKH
ncbi:MAG: F0F1 ATP synthase subunit epsilon [Nitrosomonadales bacterium]|jgi:F-type H+-transporting ATPase subunit epsilon